MKRIILAACLLVACGFVREAAAQDAADAKRQDIKRLLQITEAGEMGVLALKQMLPDLQRVFGALFTSLSAEQRERAGRIMEEEMLREFTVERVVEELIPIYDKYLTGEEVKTLIAFYETPIGKKMVAVQPKIAVEAGQAGERIAEAGAQRILLRMQAEGLEVEPPPPPKSAPAKRPPARRRRT